MTTVFGGPKKEMYLLHKCGKVYREEKGEPASTGKRECRLDSLHSVRDP